MKIEFRYALYGLNQQITQYMNGFQSANIISNTCIFYTENWISLGPLWSQSTNNSIYARPSISEYYN